MAHRMDVKLNSQKLPTIANRLHVAMPAPRDNKVVRETEPP